MPRTALLTALLILVVGTGLVFLFLAAPREESRGGTSTVVRPSFTGYGDDATPSWTLRATKGTLDGETGTFEDVEIVLHSTGGSDLTARGRTFTFDGTYGTLSGEVKVERGDGFRLEGESLTFHEPAAEIRTGPVAIHSRGGAIQAAHLTYEARTGRAFVSGGFTALVDRPALRVRGETAEEADGQLVLEGNLEIEREGESWRAARVEVDEDGETVTLLGDVEGVLPEGQIAALSLTLDADGAAAARGVHLVLARSFLGENHGP
jgi:lipopolysaccharide export system protein LptA